MPNLSNLADAAPVTLRFDRKDVRPPVYVAADFTQPPWNPVEMDVDIERSTQAEEFSFVKSFPAVESGEHQYKFKVGRLGADWTLDEGAPVAMDDSGQNRNNSITVEAGKTPENPSMVTAISSPESDIVRRVSLPPGLFTEQWSVAEPMKGPSPISGLAKLAEAPAPPYVTEAAAEDNPWRRNSAQPLSKSGAPPALLVGETSIDVEASNPDEVPLPVEAPNPIELPKSLGVIENLENAVLDQEIQPDETTTHGAEANIEAALQPEDASSIAEMSTEVPNDLPAAATSPPAAIQAEPDFDVEVMQARIVVDLRDDVPSDLSTDAAMAAAAELPGIATAAWSHEDPQLPEDPMPETNDVSLSSMPSQTDAVDTVQFGQVDRQPLPADPGSLASVIEDNVPQSSTPEMQGILSEDPQPHPPANGFTFRFPSNITSDIQQRISEASNSAMTEIGFNMSDDLTTELFHCTPLSPVTEMTEAADEGYFKTLPVEDGSSTNTGAPSRQTQTQTQEKGVAIREGIYEESPEDAFLRDSIAQGLLQDDELSLMGTLTQSLQNDQLAPVGRQGFIRRQIIRIYETILFITFAPAFATLGVVFYYPRTD